MFQTLGSNVSLIGTEFRIIDHPDLLPGNSPGSFAYTRIDREQNVIWVSRQTPRRSRDKFIARARHAASRLIPVPVYR